MSQVQSLFAVVVRSWDVRLPELWSPLVNSSSAQVERKFHHDSEDSDPTTSKVGHKWSHIFLTKIVRHLVPFGQMRNGEHGETE